MTPGDSSPKVAGAAASARFTQSVRNQRVALNCRRETARPLPHVNPPPGTLRRSGLLWAVLAMFLLAQATPPATAAPGPPAASAPRALPWGDWTEADFPFFSTVLDVSKPGDGLPEDNLSPRAVALNLGNGTWVGFDTELLRVAAIWEGHGVTPLAGAPKSYQHPVRFSGGSGPYPAPVGDVWLANGIYPGWQLGNYFAFADPREPTPSPEEVGRGPLAAELGRFRELRLTADGLRLEYSVGDTHVHEWIRAAPAAGLRAVERRFRVFPTTESLILVVAVKPRDRADGFSVALQGADDESQVRLKSERKAWTVRIAPHAQPVDFSVIVGPGTLPPEAKHASLGRLSEAPAPPRWPQEVVTRGVLATAKEAHVLDVVPLPLDNPWRRLVRLGDIQFFRDGRGAGVTVDGDVWLIDGLDGNLDRVRWRRFASGLHEPISLAIRDEQIFVYDRNGIWCLHDTNGDDEADVYQMFCNLFTQTGDLSDLPNAIKLAPDGTFVISKGGQRRRTVSRDSGTIMRVAADGKSYAVLGHGFRQPFVSVNPRTGMVTASDQEGYHVPATPLFILDQVRDHGYPRDQTLSQILAELRTPQNYPPSLAEPFVWMPRLVNSSAITQVWLHGARMGPLNDTMIHIGYNRPELLFARFDERVTRHQAAMMSLTREIPFPPLSGALNPRDGQLYVAGFELNNRTKKSDGLVRVRYTGEPFLMPMEVSVMDQGFLLRFDVPLEKGAAVNPDNYTVTRWNYQRTPNYGSPPYRIDGTMGRDTLTASSAYLSEDAKSIFIGVPDMRPGVMQMQVAWRLASRDGAKVEGEAHLTPHELGRFLPKTVGFADITVDLRPRESTAPVVEEPVSASDGQRLARAVGCYACHTRDGSESVGPTWKGLAGSVRVLTNGEKVIADDAYLAESILLANAKVVAGYEEGMPSYAGLMGEAQIQSLVLYIKSLASK